MPAKAPLPDLKTVEGFCPHCGAPMPAPEGELRHGWIYRADLGELRGPAGQHIHLPGRAARLLEVLWRRFGTVIHTEALQDSIWGYESDINVYANLKVQLTHLRKALRQTPFEIVAAWGRGSAIELKKEPPR